MPTYKMVCVVCSYTKEELMTVQQYIKRDHHCPVCKRDDVTVKMQQQIGATPLMFTEFLHAKGRHR